METNLYNRDKYTKSIILLKSEEDRYRCLQLLTSKNNTGLCHGIYGDQDIKRFMDMSEYILLRRESGTSNVVAFAFMNRVRSKSLDIVLVCTIPNKQRFGNMIAFDIHEYGVRNRYTRIITEPRTPELRHTFIKYGFEPLHGEILEKDIVVTHMLAKTNKTLKLKSKIKKPRTISNIHSTMEHVF
jgi:hypothetical protein